MASFKAPFAGKERGRGPRTMHLLRNKGDDVTCQGCKATFPADTVVQVPDPDEYRFKCTTAFPSNTGAVEPPSTQPPPTTTGAGDELAPPRDDVAHRGGNDTDTASWTRAAGAHPRSNAHAWRGDAGVCEDVYGQRPSKAERTSKPKARYCKKCEAILEPQEEEFDGPWCAECGEPDPNLDGSCCGTTGIDEDEEPPVTRTPKEEAKRNGLPITAKDLPPPATKEPPAPQPRLCASCDEYVSILVPLPDGTTVCPRCKRSHDTERAAIPPPAAPPAPDQATPPATTPEPPSQGNDGATQSPRQSNAPAASTKLPLSSPGTPSNDGPLWWRILFRPANVVAQGCWMPFDCQAPSKAAAQDFLEKVAGIPLMIKEVAPCPMPSVAQQ